MASRKKGAEKRGVGRPKLPNSEARSERIVAHLRRKDFEALERWARERGLQAGQLAREILERALRRRR